MRIPKVEFSALFAPLRLYVKKHSFAVILAAAGLCSSACATKQPNILFIAVDDLKPLLGCYGNAEIKSPNIDKLAERGTVFLNNACQQAVCGPSRASLMTGTYPDTTKVFNLRTKMREANPETLSLPEYLRQNGYETTGAGKIYDPRCVDKEYDAASWTQPFHHNVPAEYYAEGHGNLDSAYRNPEVAKAEKVLKAYLKKNGIKKKSPAYKKAMSEHPMAKPVAEGLEMPDDAYNDGATVNYALKKMEELAGGEKPFFLAVGLKKPHLPFVAPKKYWDLYDPSKIELASFQKMPEGSPEYATQDCWELRSGYSGIPAGPVAKEKQLELIHGYRACVSYADALIGKLLDKLEALKLADNTIVVLWGDHGFHLGDHGMFCKHTNYEQAVRSPLILAAPQQKAKGGKTESPTEFVDVFPTLCELAGLPVPERVEGLSLTALLNDPNASVREAALAQYHRNNTYMGYTLRDKRYRYVKWIKTDFYGGERTGPTDAVELYDYEQDALETVNLATNPEYKDVVAKFERLLKKRGVAQEK